MVDMGKDRQVSDVFSGFLGHDPHLPGPGFFHDPGKRTLTRPIKALKQPEDGNIPPIRAVWPDREAGREDDPLIEIKSDGNERETWIETTMAYVPHVARRYIGCGLPFDELIACGNLGLVEAAIRYQPERGVKFVTYADWWIRKSMLSAIQQQADPVRVPRYRSEKAARIREARRELRSARTGEPGIDEVAEASGIPAKEVHRILAMSMPPLSLHQPAKADGSLLLEDVLVNRAQKDTAELWIRRQFTNWVLSHLSDLDPREREILILRYGLLGTPALTLRKIGAQVGLSRERVRQVEHSALAHLREMI